MATNIGGFLKKNIVPIIVVLFFIGIFLIWVLSIRKREPFIEGKSPPDYVDVIYYINLDHRTDRDAQFLWEMERANIPKEKIVRVSAVLDKNRGDLGCSKSHIKALSMFMQSNYTNCIIFEDDFQWTQEPADIDMVFSRFFQTEIEYDVCMLSANEYNVKDTPHDFIKRVLDAQTTSGYMVNKSFAPILLENFIEGARLLEESYNDGRPNGEEYCVDQYWKRLQLPNNWYMFFPKLGKQRESFSDIQGGVMDYGI